MAISDDEKLFVGGGVNEQARVFSTDNGEPAATFEAKAPIGAVAFSGQDEAALLFIGTRGGSLLVFHVASRKQVCAATFFARSSDAKGSDVNALALNKLGDRLVVGAIRRPSLSCTRCRVFRERSHKPVINVPRTFRGHSVNFP